MDEGHTDWLDGELASFNFADERLTERLRKLQGQRGGAMGQSIPFACQEWANAKGAYRFLSNDRSTRRTFRACAGLGDNTHVAASGEGPLLW
jgi:hypothetical protein